MSVSCHLQQIQQRLKIRPRGWICNRARQFQVKGCSKCVSNPTRWSQLLELTQVPSDGLNSKANVNQSLVIEELLSVENKCRLCHFIIDTPVIVTGKLVPAENSKTRFCYETRFYKLLNAESYLKPKRNMNALYLQYFFFDKNLCVSTWYIGRLRAPLWQPRMDRFLSQPDARHPSVDDHLLFYWEMNPYCNKITTRFVM